MRFLIIEHLDSEPAGLIGETIAAAGHELHHVRVGDGAIVPADCDGWHGIVVMGGPMSANDSHLSYIVQEIELLKRAIETDTPVLGICLGSQLLARAAGGDVTPSPLRELGWYPVIPSAEAAGDPLFAALSAEGMKVFQWHGETFSLPEGAKLLATASDVPNQAFRIGSSQYGLQFHIEVDAPVIDSWIEGGESEREALGRNGVDRIRAESPDNLPEAHRFCRKMVAAWLKLAEKD